MAETHVIPMTVEHASAVLRIYQAGIDTGDATFETVAPDWETFDRVHLDHHRFVAVNAVGDVVGWVAAVPVSSRCVYAGVMEHSVYVDTAARSAGVGGLLLAALIASAEQAGVWTIQSGIFPGKHRQPGGASSSRVPHRRRS
ncbi:GNAT family N-acetyltransferase [Williamsia herbipolensis]|uniref:GNAT family N-acetyltransferase n=1 Tax=Williamsia herbipolensis TaxID=1603258 RepID=UPI000AE763F1|nr:GNAT family N-acetyltransferase [Williamsia herbipolensis]MCX6471858.1 GNAT family N-acetyltransferase [Mycobacteriales bacterium]